MEHESSHAGTRRFLPVKLSLFQALEPVDNDGLHLGTEAHVILWRRLDKRAFGIEQVVSRTRRLDSLR